MKKLLGFLCIFALLSCTTQTRTTQDANKVTKTRQTQILGATIWTDTTDTIVIDTSEVNK